VSHPEWVTQGAKFAIIDYNDQSTLLGAFDGVDVVISAVSGGPDVIQGQKVLADAAKAAGVKIFAPSEYGGPSAKLEGLVALKGEIRDYLREIELPYAILYTGPWTDVIFYPQVSLYPRLHLCDADACLCRPKGFRIRFCERKGYRSWNWRCPDQFYRTT